MLRPMWILKRGMSHHKAILWALGRSQRPLARRYDAAPVTASAISAAAASRTGQRRNLAQSAPNDRESIPTLDKPLGVSYLGISPELAQKISNRTASMRQRIQRSLQPEHLATQRQQLVKEFNRSYWQDFRDMSKRGGKQWIAPNRLLKQGVSLFMPSIYGRTLDRTSGEKCTTDDILRHKCTVVSIASTRFGERNIDEMIAPAVATFPRERSASHGVLFLHINLQENPLKAGLVQLFIPNIKRTIPKFSHVRHSHLSTPSRRTDPIRTFSALKSFKVERILRL